MQGSIARGVSPARYRVTISRCSPASRANVLGRGRLSRRTRISYDYADGYMHPGELPGLGVEFDEAAAARYPYSARYLPVNRLTDGSVHDW